MYLNSCLLLMSEDSIYINLSSMYVFPEVKLCVWHRRILSRIMSIVNNIRWEVLDILHVYFIRHVNKQPHRCYIYMERECPWQEVTSQLTVHAWFSYLIRTNGKIDSKANKWHRLSPGKCCYVQWLPHKTLRDTDPLKADGCHDANVIVVGDTAHCFLWKPVLPPVTKKCVWWPHPVAIILL